MVYVLLQTLTDVHAAELVQGETQDPLPQDGQPVPAAVLQPRGSLQAANASRIADLICPELKVPAGTSDVVTAVNIARQNNLTIAAEGGGGGYVSLDSFSLRPPSQQLPS